ncbi:MAG: CDP-alcohol phosphatidyltransferase family protein [Actinomycetes bacterium]
MNRTIYTIPNALTFLRALGIPLFAYLALSRHADAWAVAVLAVGGATDYFDGKLARAWNQTSRLGEIMDPAIDRAYIAVTLIVLLIRGAIPLWLIVVIVIRDLILGILTLAMKRRGLGLLTVTYSGKAATFNLLYAFPFLLLALGDTTLGDIAFVVGWSFALWGEGLYLSTGVDYFISGWRKLSGAN